MSTGRSNNPLYDERGQFIKMFQELQVMQRNLKTAAPPTTYESLKVLSVGLVTTLKLV